MIAEDPLDVTVLDAATASELSRIAADDAATPPDRSSSAASEMVSKPSDMARLRLRADGYERKAVGVIGNGRAVVCENDLSGRDRCHHPII